MDSGFFINNGSIPASNNEGLVSIDNDKVIVNIPLDFHIDSDGNVFVGNEDKNAQLVYVNRDEIYARKVV